MLFDIKAISKAFIYDIKAISLIFMNSQLNSSSKPMGNFSPTGNRWPVLQR